MSAGFVALLLVGYGSHAFVHGMCVPGSHQCLVDDSTSLMQISQEVKVKGTNRGESLSHAAAHEDAPQKMFECMSYKCNIQVCGSSAKDYRVNEMSDSEGWEIATIKNSKTKCPKYTERSDCCEEKYSTKDGIHIFYRLDTKDAKTDADVCASCAYKDEGIFDLMGHRVKRNAAYHASVKIGLTSPKGESALKVEMAPKAIVSTEPIGNNVMDPVKDFTLFVADADQGYVSSCKEGQVYKSASLRLKKDITFGDLAKAVSSAPSWNPATYNCQSFSVDVIVNLAEEPEKMRAMLESLTHDAPALTSYTGVKAGLVNAAANVAAGTMGVVQSTGLVDIPLKDMIDPSTEYGKASAPYLGEKINGVRLYFSESFTYGLTTSATRKADFDRRQDTMCSSMKTDIAGGLGELIPEGSNPLKNKL